MKAIVNFFVHKMDWAILIAFMFIIAIAKGAVWLYYDVF